MTPLQKIQEGVNLLTRASQASLSPKFSPVTLRGSTDGLPNMRLISGDAALVLGVSQTPGPTSDVWLTATVTEATA